MQQLIEEGASRYLFETATTANGKVQVSIDAYIQSEPPATGFIRVEYDPRGMPGLVTFAPASELSPYNSSAPAIRTRYVKDGHEGLDARDRFCMMQVMAERSGEIPLTGSVHVFTTVADNVDSAPMRFALMLLKTLGYIAQLPSSFSADT